MSSPSGHGNAQRASNGAWKSSTQQNPTNGAYYQVEDLLPETRNAPIIGSTHTPEARTASTAASAPSQPNFGSTVAPAHFSQAQVGPTGGSMYYQPNFGSTAGWAYSTPAQVHPANFSARHPEARMTTTAGPFNHQNGAPSTAGSYNPPQARMASPPASFSQQSGTASTARPAYHAQARMDPTPMAPPSSLARLAFNTGLPQSSRQAVMGTGPVSSQLPPSRMASGPVSSHLSQAGVATAASHPQPTQAGTAPMATSSQPSLAQLAANSGLPQTSQANMAPTAGSPQPSQAPQKRKRLTAQSSKATSDFPTGVPEILDRIPQLPKTPQKRQKRVASTAGSGQQFSTPPPTVASKAGGMQPIQHPAPRPMPSTAGSQQQLQSPPPTVASKAGPSQHSHHPTPRPLPLTGSSPQNSAANQPARPSSTVATSNSTQPVQTQAQPQRQPINTSVPSQQTLAQPRQTQTLQPNNAASDSAASNSTPPVQSQAQPTRDSSTVGPSSQKVPAQVQPAQASQPTNASSSADRTAGNSTQPAQSQAQPARNPAAALPPPPQSPARPTTQTGNNKVQIYTKILARDTIAIVGDFGAKRPIYRLAQWIEANGGTYAPDISSKVTKLICSWQAWKEKGPMVSKALKYKDISVVSYDWLEDSIIERARLDTYGYDMQEVDIRRTAEKETRKEHIDAVVKKEAVKYKQSRSISQKVADPCAPAGWQLYRDHNGLQYAVILNRPHLTLNWTETWTLCMYISIPHGERPAEASVQAQYYGLPCGGSIDGDGRDYKFVEVTRSTDMIGIVKDRFKAAFLQLTGVEWDFRVWGQRQPVCVKHIPIQYNRLEDGRLIRDWKYKFEVRDDEDYRCKIFPWYYTFDQKELTGDTKHGNDRRLLHGEGEMYWRNDEEGNLQFVPPSGLVWPLKKPPPPPPDDDELDWGGGPGTLGAEGAAREKKNQKKKNGTSKNDDDDGLDWGGGPGTLGGDAAAKEKSKQKKKNGGVNGYDGPNDDDCLEVDANGKRKRASGGNSDDQPAKKRGRGRPKKNRDDNNNGSGNGLGGDGAGDGPSSGNGNGTNNNNTAHGSINPNLAPLGGVPANSISSNINKRNKPEPILPTPQTENMFFTYELPDMEHGDFVGHVDMHWGVAAFGNWRIPGSGAAAPSKVKEWQGKRWVGGDVAWVD
ncbi:MAG: hypothetical protein M1831_002282 [Alyxoria varia]|nr:MAG: hypothetical protein M1831_002282 [Alyxoria varia]